MELRIKNFILRSAVHFSERLKEELKIVPNLYMVKEFYGETGFLFLLITPVL